MKLNHIWILMSSSSQSRRSIWQTNMMKYCAVIGVLPSPQLGYHQACHDRAPSCATSSSQHHLKTHGRGTRTVCSRERESEITGLKPLESLLMLHSPQALSLLLGAVSENCFSPPLWVASAAASSTPSAVPSVDPSAVPSEDPRADPLPLVY